MDKPLIFVSYSREDTEQKDELVNHLNVLVRHAGFELWVDDRLACGDEWERTILRQIDRAVVAVLLVSEHFLNSDFICEKELPALQRRREAGALRMIPIIGRSCAWDSVAWLKALDVRPKNNEPVWAGDEAATREHLTAIANEIVRLVGRSPADARPAPQDATGNDAPGTAPIVEYEPTLHRKQFLRILDEFSDAIQSESVERMFGRDALRRWRRHDESIRERLDAEFSLTVIGPFKRGKSMLINALLGQEMVTSDIAPETVTINEIRHGETSAIAACLSDGGRMRLKPNQIKRQALEPALAGVSGRLSHLDVRAPVEWLRGVCLVDTPGTGDLLQRFDRQVQDYLTRADAVLFVLSPLAPLSESERAFLRLAVLSQDFGKITFVVNMLDKVRSEKEVGQVMDYLRAGVERMFPGAVLFGVSALDELSRLKDEPRPAPERRLSLAARFEALRAHVQESIIDNRELIQIDRASAEFKSLLQNVVQHANQVRWAIDTDRRRLEGAIDACESSSSALHSRVADDVERLKSTLTALGRETREWLEVFLDRLERVAQDLSRFSADDLQRHFPFFLADAVRTAIHRCLEAQRPLIIAAVRQVGPGPSRQETNGSSRDATLQLPEVLRAAVEGSTLEVAAAGDAVWDRLELSKMLLDLAQTQIFGVAAGLIRHFDESGRERRKSILYQQQFLTALPELRRSVLEQAEKVYDSIAARLVEEVERQRRQQVQESLEAFRQGRHLLAAGDAKRDLAALDRVSSLVQETEDALSALQQKWWSQSEAPSDGTSNLALEFPASS
jgi:predicted GTPase